MNNTAHELEQPQIHRTLEYRPQLRWTYFLLLGSAPLISAICTLYAFSLFNQQRHAEGIIVVGLSFSFALFEFAVAWYWLKPLAFTKVLVSNHGVTLDRKGVLAEIPFYRVSSLQFSFLPYLGGWFVLKMQDGRQFRFTAGLERCDYLLDALAIAQPTLMPSAELARYRRICIGVDHVFARIQGTFAQWPSFLAMQIGLPALLTADVVMGLSAQNYSEVPLLFAAIGTLNSFVALLLWVSNEWIEIRRKDHELLDNPLNPLRDMRREVRHKFYSRMLHVAVMCALILWVRVL